VRDGTGGGRSHHVQNAKLPLTSDLGARWELRHHYRFHLQGRRGGKRQAVGCSGSRAWAGLANTSFWIDPSRDVAGAVLMQLLPFADKQCLEAFAGFARGVYGGLDSWAKGGVNVKLF